MAHTIYEGWAPPGRIWGPWIELAGWSTGLMAREIILESQSQAPSTFDVELEYFVGNERKVDKFIGPGTHQYGFGMCFCISRLRMRSHVVGQVVRIMVRD